MRTTYGREQKAHDFIVSNGGTAFLPLIKQEKVIKGKKTIVDVSRIQIFSSFMELKMR